MPTYSSALQKSPVAMVLKVCSFSVDSTDKALSVSAFFNLLKEIFTFQYMKHSDSSIFKRTGSNIKEFYHFIEDFCYILSCKKTNSDGVELLHHSAVLHEHMHAHAKY